jgi:hypothetical protein
VASVAASLISELIIAAIAHGAGAYSDFPPLTFRRLLGPTFVGLLTAVVVWELVRRRAGDPVAVMRRLAPIVIVLSWVPDVVLGATHQDATGQLPDTTWGEVAVLMVMHLVVAAIGLGLFSWLLPLRRTPIARSTSIDTASDAAWALSPHPAEQPVHVDPRWPMDDQR